VAVACADLYPRSPCHEAWRDFGNQSDATTLATACSRAYCSLLAAPVPTLCQPGHVMPSGGELQPLWIELDTAIIGYELNLDREAASQASVAQILGQMMAPVRVALPAGAPDNADNPDVVIQIRKRDSGIEIRIDAVGGAWPLSAQPTAAELAPMVAAVKATGLEQPVIVLEPAADVSHAVVVGIVEALKRAHFGRLAIGTAEKEK
jgi:biopolymer transport protein ExbD